MLLLLLFNKAKDAFVILKLLQIRVANGYEKHTESYEGSWITGVDCERKN